MDNTTRKAAGPPLAKVGAARAQPVASRQRSDVTENTVSSDNPSMGSSAYTLSGQPEHAERFFNALIADDIVTDPKTAVLAAVPLAFEGMYAKATRTFESAWPVVSLGCHPRWGPAAVHRFALGDEWSTGRSQQHADVCSKLACDHTPRRFNAIIGPGWGGNLKSLFTAGANEVLALVCRGSVTLHRSRLQAEDFDAPVKPGAWWLQNSTRFGSTKFTFSRKWFGDYGFVRITSSKGGVAASLAMWLSSGLSPPELDFQEGVKYGDARLSVPKPIADAVGLVLFGRDDDNLTDKLARRTATRLARDDVDSALAAYHFGVRKYRASLLGWTFYPTNPASLGYGLLCCLVGVGIGVTVAYWPREVLDFLLRGAVSTLSTATTLLARLVNRIEYGDARSKRRVEARVLPRFGLVVNALAEEMAKRVPIAGPWICTGIVGLESYFNYHAGTLPDYIVVASLHFVWMSCPLPLAVTSHVLWNMGAVTPARLMDTIWGIMNKERPQPVVGVCIGESGEAWPASCKTASCTPPIIWQCQRRLAAWPIGPTLAACTPVVFRSCVCNEYAAVCSRICRAPLWDASVRKNKIIWSKVELLLPKIIDHLQREVDLDDYGDHTEEEWLSRYPSGARPRLQRHLYDARAGHFSSLTAKSFIKVERLPAHALVTLFETKKPRLIQGRSDSVKCAVGPWFWWLSKKLSGAFQDAYFGDIYYASGASADDLGLWASECEHAGYIPYSCDFSAYDGSVGPGPLSLWARFCEALNPPERIVRFLRTRRNVQRGKTRFGVVYKRLAQVSSGDGDTTVGNSFIGIMGWCWVLRTLNVEYRLLVLGDDAVVATKRRLDVDRVCQLWASLGFRLDIKPSEDWDYASFCSGYFWQVGGGQRVFGPNPARVLCKTFWTVQKLNERKARARLRGIVHGLWLTSSHVPILRELLVRLRKLLGGGKMILLRDHFERPQARCRPRVSEDAILQLAKILDCSPGSIVQASREASQASLHHCFSGGFWAVVGEFAAS